MMARSATSPKTKPEDSEAVRSVSTPCYVVQMAAGSGWRGVVAMALGVAIVACSLTNLDDLKGAGAPDGSAGGGTGGSAGAGTGGGSDGGSCVPLSCADVAAECGKITDGCWRHRRLWWLRGFQVLRGRWSEQVRRHSLHAGDLRCQNRPSAEASLTGCGDILDCGACSDPNKPICSALNECTSTACTPKTCQTANAECGSVGDGCGKVLDCGSCSGSKALCEDNQCICDPDSCSSLALNCGAVSDGCGNTLNCGKCTGRESCVSGSCQDVVTTACGPCPTGFTSAATAPDPSCGPAGGVCPAVNIRSICVKAGVASQAYCSPGSCPSGTHLGLSTFHCTCGGQQIHLCVAD